MMRPFEQASYRAQVLRLRKMAKSAIARYPIRVASLDFINHGENATFKVQARNGQRFLLRIHRGGYHSPEAIAEELRWLEQLGQATDLAIPRPVRSKENRLIETASQTGITTARQCCVFEWVEGRFIRKSVSPKHLQALGRVMAELQKNSRKIIHRRYWHADGLLGFQAKFGSIEHLAGIPARDQNLISEGRRIVLRKLKKFESAFPERMGLIHADMHFGNILLSNGNIGVIDFDDCGIGFHAYDLVVPILSLENILGDKNLSTYRDALIAGYTSRMSWDRHDDAILPYLMTARRLAMLGWLHSRSDNPRLKKRLKEMTTKAVTHLKTDLGL